jgi:hypothetical protein
MCRSALLALLSLAVWLQPALAHTRSETHSAWQIQGAIVHLSFTVPDLEARRVGEGGAAPSDETLGRYLDAHLAVSAGDKTCPRSAGPLPLAAVPGYRKFDFAFACPDAAGIALTDSAFFELVPTHVNFAQIQTADGRLIEQLFTAERETLDLSGGAGENRLQDAGFLDYVAMGVMHIFTGIDHQFFLLGLVLIARRVRDLVFVVTGFTLGHSVTLALAVTGIIRPHAEYIDALIGLTIVLIGAENFGDMTHRPAVMALGLLGLLTAMTLAKLLGFGGLPAPLLLGAGLFGANYLMITARLRDAARFRLVVTLVFGLIHGFGFAADLLELRLPADRLAELLVGFNLGVEIGQLSLVVAVLAVTALAVRWRLAFPRPIVVDVASSALVATGLFWFVGRSYL